MTIVLDASTVVAALVDSGPDGRWAESLLTSDLAAPTCCWSKSPRCSAGRPAPARSATASAHPARHAPSGRRDGNHEDLELLDACHAQHPADAVVPVDPSGAFAHVRDGTVLEIGPFRVACLGGIDFPNTPWDLDRDAIEQLKRERVGSVDVLVTHDGPDGIATNWRGHPQGSPVLTDLVDWLRPRLHVNGHYHDAVGPRPEGDTVGYMLAGLVDPAVDPWGRNPGNPTQRVTEGSIGLLHDDGTFELVDDPWLADIAGEDLDLGQILGRYA